MIENEKNECNSLSIHIKTNQPPYQDNFPPIENKKFSIPYFCHILENVISFGNGGTNLLTILMIREMKLSLRQKRQNTSSTARINVISLTDLT